MRRPQLRHKTLRLFAKTVCGQREALDAPSGCLWSASCAMALARCPPDARDSVKDANHIDHVMQDRYEAGQKSSDEQAETPVNESPAQFGARNSIFSAAYYRVAHVNSPLEGGLL
jgi:hypothetical protein